MTPMETLANCLLSRWLTADQVVDEADPDRSGGIEFEDFCDLCVGTLQLSLSEIEIRDIFDLMDADESGCISPDELKQAIEKSTKSRVAKMLADSYIDQEQQGESSPADTKLVALVAHNNMKPGMMTFVAKHREFFKTMRIVTTGSTGGALEKKLGLKIAHKVASGPLGGDQEIGGMITNDQVAATFFFIDPLSSHPHEADIRALTRICQVHNCAMSTNPISGEALVHAFQTSPMHIDMLHQNSKRGESAVVQEYKQAQQTVITAVAK